MVIQMTTDWTQINLSGKFSDFSEYEQRYEMVYHFTVDGVSYDLRFDIMQQCCEEFSLTTTPDIPFSSLDKIDRLDITYLNGNDNAFLVNFYCDSDKVYTITFANNHNGYYSHSIQFDKDNKSWFWSSI